MSKLDLARAAILALDAYEAKGGAKAFPEPSAYGRLLRSFGRVSFARGDCGDPG